MISYCCGFVFDFYRSELVVLVEKKRPEWQKGKLNGVGGHIEKGETPRQAMVREFQEETGIETFESDWTKLLRLHCGYNWEVYFYKAFLKNLPILVETQTDEHIAFYQWNKLYEMPVIPNLRWLIPMCFDNGLVGEITIEDKGIGGE